MTMKACRGCGKTKPVSAFYPRKWHVSQYRHRCKECQRVTGKAWYRAHTEHVAARKKRWYETNKGRALENTKRWRETPSGRVSMIEARLRLRYGIGIEAYDALLRAQSGCCAICGKEPKGRRLAVDHDHSTKHVRGLLCGPCNRGIGYLSDSPERLRRAIAYLGSAEE